MELVIFQLLRLCVFVFAFAFVTGRSTGLSVSPSPSVSPGITHVNAPSSATESNWSNLHPPLTEPSFRPSPVPESPTTRVESPKSSTPQSPAGTEEYAPSLPPHSPLITAPPPLNNNKYVPSVSPSASVSVPVAPAPVPTPLEKSLQNSSTNGTTPASAPTKAPITEAIAPVPNATPLINSTLVPRNISVPSPSHSFLGDAPTEAPIPEAVVPVPIALPSKRFPQNSSIIHRITPASAPSHSVLGNAPDKATIPEVVAPVGSQNSTISPIPSPPPSIPGSASNSAPNPEAFAPVQLAPRSKGSPQSSPTIHESIPNSAPLPSVHGNAPSNAHIPETLAPVPVTSPLRNPPDISPTAPHPNTSRSSGHANTSNSSNNHAPSPQPFASVTPPPNKLEATPPAGKPRLAPTESPKSVATPPQRSPAIQPITPRESPSPLPADFDASPVIAPPPQSISKKKSTPVGAPPPEVSEPLAPTNHKPNKAPSPHRARRRYDYARVPSLAPLSPPYKESQSPAPLASFTRHQRRRQKIASPAPPPEQQDSFVSPYYSPPSSESDVSPASSPSPIATTSQTIIPFISPSGSSSTTSKVPPIPPMQALPPPPPNEDCSTTTCFEPYTNTAPGSRCGCVWPMQVGLRFSVALYTFFPLVSEFAKEIADGVFMKQSQVRIMGANAASEQPDKSVVLLDLVPLGEKFDNTTAFLTSDRFWHKSVAINASLFGEYDVLYVRYPGLPSPPPSTMTMIDGVPYPGNSDNSRPRKPIGVDVRNKRHKNGLSGGVIAIIVLSISVAVVLSFSVLWVLLFKRRNRASNRAPAQPRSLSSLAKPSASGGSIIGSALSSASLSFGSSMAPYAGSAKTFSASEMEKATDNFDTSRILGEGGFGLVYKGILEDGMEVAVKVLKRNDQQGGREFLAEVEMLSRLHHRNLVKLIGICTEERTLCLVYELIRNGSVDSHLHGIDKETAPLDWDSRLKIALGAARGLAYLHEDSSPRVIHRDFKSSNILLEHDFTPKVSDFGLARTAFDEENRHISTRVMGTFGYVAPEYAMTGHLLVKSDVYSYGVVLLELLTGRKPVDMSQPPGEENLVSWARPLLATTEGLESIIDASLKPDVPFDSVAKVAAIASMCVQPEVSHRPFMGEVVQALKLVCNECDEAREIGSRSSSSSSSQNDDLSIDMGVARENTSHYSAPNYNSEPDTERGISTSEFFGGSRKFERPDFGSLRRNSSSGPLGRGRGGRNKQFWHKIWRSGGSVSEHRIMFRSQTGTSD